MSLSPMQVLAVNTLITKSHIHSSHSSALHLYGMTVLFEKLHFQAPVEK